MGWTVSRSCLQHHSGEGGEANGRLILVVFFNIVSGNGLVSPDNRPLLDLCHHMLSLGHNGLMNLALPSQ